jgi:hypothetical protein
MFALLFALPKPKSQQQPWNKRRTKWNVVCQNPHEIIPGFLQRVLLEHRAGKILNAQPIDLHDSGVGKHLQGDEQQPKKHEGNAANFAQRESNRKSSDATETDLSQVRRELIEDFLIHARSISIFWCDPGECWLEVGFELQNKSQARVQPDLMEFGVYRFTAGFTVAGVLFEAGSTILVFPGTNGVNGTGRLNPATRGSCGCAP